MKQNEFYLILKLDCIQILQMKNLVLHVVLEFEFEIRKKNIPLTSASLMSQTLLPDLI